jgi:hypothetical protein
LTCKTSSSQEHPNTAQPNFFAPDWQLQLDYSFATRGTMTIHIAPDALMRLLIPEGRVDEASTALNLSRSLIYQERRKVGDSHIDTGTRNSIARLDIIAELALSHTPHAVRLLGQRYIDLYENFLNPHDEAITEDDLRRALATACKEVGEALAALTEHTSILECSVEVGEAETALLRALHLVQSLKSKAGAYV